MKFCLTKIVGVHQRIHHFRELWVAVILFASATNWLWVTMIRKYSKLFHKLYFREFWKIVIIVIESISFDFRLIYTIEASVGGFVVISDRENKNKNTYHYVGTTKTLSYLYRWDTVEPYHCIAKMNVSSINCPQYLNVPDLTENVCIPSVFTTDKWRYTFFILLFKQ